MAPRPATCDCTEKEQEERDRQFFSFGKFLAIAVLYPQPLPISFNLVLCKHFLKMPVDMEDLRRFDEDFFRQRVKRVLDPGGLEFLEQALGEKLTFMSVGKEVKVAGRSVRIPPCELVPGGARKVVDESNKA